jgi:hypothetical protein
VIDFQKLMHCICTSMDVRGKKVYHTYMILKSVMYGNVIDKVKDIVFVTFSPITQSRFVYTKHTQLPKYLTQNKRSTTVHHTNPSFPQDLSILLTKCISILMLQINSHAKKWRFTS